MTVTTSIIGSVETSIAVPRARITAGSKMNPTILMVAPHAQRSGSTSTSEQEEKD